MRALDRYCSAQESVDVGLQGVGGDRGVVAPDLVQPRTGRLVLNRYLMIAVS